LTRISFLEDLLPTVLCRSLTPLSQFASPHNFKQTTSNNVSSDYLAILNDASDFIYLILHKNETEMELN
jgi:hypothetical protein